MIFNDYILLIRDSRDGTLTGRLGAGRCQQNPGFNPRLAYLGFICGKVALGQDSFLVLIFLSQRYCTNTDSLIHISPTLQAQ